MTRWLALCLRPSERHGGHVDGLNKKANKKHFGSLLVIFINLPYAPSLFLFVFAYFFTSLNYFLEVSLKPYTLKKRRTKDWKTMTSRATRR